MYKSPIDIIPGQLELQLEDEILWAVQKVGVAVDKDELLRALKYDRDQYNTGYQDGKAESVVHGEWKFWEGWMSNHDMRIEDATCSVCGYKHPTVRRTYGIRETMQDVLNKLSNYCADCGAKMDRGTNNDRHRKAD